MQGYHLLALILFSPALIAEPQLLAVSLAIACALLIIVEAIRVSNVPYLGPWIHGFMTSFIDERDSGLLLVGRIKVYGELREAVSIVAGLSMCQMISSITLLASIA